MKITESFDDSEFACKCGCGKCDINIPLVHRLQVIRDIVKLPIKINSGCRCIKHNDEVGGEKHSLHLLGLAADFTLPREPETLRRLCLNLIANWSGGFHYYPDRNFCHVDVGKRRRW